MAKRHFHYITIVKTNKAKYYYVGKHSTADINDGYFGSGVIIGKMCKRFPHKTRIINEFLSEKESYAEEIHLVIKAKLKYGKQCVNLADGGRGKISGTKLSAKTKRLMSISKIGKRWGTKRKESHKMHVIRGSKHHTKNGLSDEYKMKISNSLIGKNLGKTHTAEAKARMSESKSGELNPMYGKPGAMKGKPAPNRNISWQLEDKLFPIWVSNNRPSAYLFRKLVTKLGYPNCSYRGLISKWLNCTLCTQA
ncbi:homing endonuclease [Citrobacter phage Moon]|uniref:Homing endonuclease n=1 Tax=Citrobacter phage Moon TaxID=1540095 RepID=A0A0A0YVG9_9CAUD|nr:homing endonuclease [Citrobacter phage Moon]AIX12090.1 homing endonuclease [Citrobacter phage Moon]